MKGTLKRAGWFLVAIGWCWLVWADEPPGLKPPPEETPPPRQEELVVDLTCILPAEGPPVDGGALVVRLHEYDPRAAGQAAREIGRITVAGIVHRPGLETTMRFPCTGRTAQRKAYYLTAVVYPDAETSDRGGIYFLPGFQRVLPAGNRQTLWVTLSPVGTPEDPTN